MNGWNEFNEQLSGIKHFFITTQKMKYIFLVFFLVICFCNVQGHNENRSKYKIKRIKETEFLVLKSRNQNLVVDIGSIKKEKMIISLPIKNGKVVILKDTLTEEESPEMVEYNYMGELELLNVYIVEAVYINGSKLWLINKTNGKIAKMLRFLSATKKHVVTYDIPENDEYNGIEVFEKKNDKLIRLFTIKENWFPDEIVWNSNDSFIIKAKSFDNQLDLYFKVTLHNSSL